LLQVYDESQRGFYLGEMDGKSGRFPSGLTRKIAGSEAPNYQPPVGNCQ
jgi:hypothetical protein